MYTSPVRFSSLHSAYPASQGPNSAVLMAILNNSTKNLRIFTFILHSRETQCFKNDRLSLRKTRTCPCMGPMLPKQMRSYTGYTYFAPIKGRGYSAQYNIPFEDSIPFWNSLKFPKTKQMSLANHPKFL